ncbi:YraN family protein [Acetobacter sp. AN02]|nr:YraN family protein [Acetobacter sp. AN02]
MHRAKTPAGETDLVALQGGVLIFVEVKRRKTLEDAAFSLSLRQQKRLAASAEILISRNPEWIYDSIRFDVILLSADSRIEHIRDGFRLT